MYICDLHCDLPDKVLGGASLTDDTCHWALHKLQKENTYLQVFAHFTDARKQPNVFLHTTIMLQRFTDALAASTVHLIKSAADLKQNMHSGSPMALLSIEGGEALDGKTENVAYFYNLGVRFLTLTWNLKNDFGESCVSGNAPVTTFGLQVLSEMNRLRMTPDISHLCEQGFWSVIEHSNRPVIATHSNSKSVCDHPRNLTDKQFCALRDCGGLVGINFYPPFLESDAKKADINSIIKHIEHFLALGGENTLCLGSDFDGIPLAAHGLADIGDIHKIANAMARLGYSDTLILKIMGENVLNFLLENLQA